MSAYHAKKFPNYQYLRIFNLEVYIFIENLVFTRLDEFYFFQKL